MANKVIYSNLFSEARNNVVALITTSNVPDPNTATAEYRKRIYSREPDVKSSDFKGYPYIIVWPTDVDIEKEKGRQSLDGKSKIVYWDIEVEIFSSDRGYGEKDANGLADIDSLSDNLAKTFQNKSNRTTLSTNNLHFSGFTTTAVTTENIANERVYKRSFMLSFESRMQVSD